MIRVGELWFSYAENVIALLISLPCIQITPNYDWRVRVHMCHSACARPSIFICSAFSFHSSRLVCPWFRSIAKVVSQVHAFQGVACPYSPDRELQDYLRRRISWLAASDRQLMATDAGLQQSSERQSRKIQEKLKRVKASFEWAPSVVPRRTTLQCPGSGHPHASSQLVIASFCSATLTRWKASSRHVSSV